MAYREPAVRVTQEFVNALPALAAFALPHVNVGPAFQVVNNGSAGVYAGLAANYDYPEQIAGSYVDTRAYDSKDLVSFPVKVLISNTVLRILNITGTGEVPVLDLNQFTDATLNAFLNVNAGDVISVTGSGLGNNGLFTVREKLTNNAVKTNETFVAAEPGLSYSVRRNVQSSVGNIDKTAEATITTTQVTLPVGMTYTLSPFGACPILSADVLVTYRALRIEKSADVWQYSKVSELQADFGIDQIVPENPAVFAAFISLQTAVVTTNLLALNSMYLDNELLSYQNALDVLALTEMYAINVLTQSTPVHAALKAHCEGLSLPNNALERVGLVNRKIVLVATVVDEITTGIAEGLAGLNNLVLTSAASQFLTDGVVPGHFILVSAPAPVVGRYKIASVDSQTQVTLVGPVAAPALAVSFAVEKDLQKSEQAAVLGAYASSLGSRRLVVVWPDEVKGPVGSEIKVLPGYFLGAVVGALTTGLPTQQGLTNLSVGFFTGVKHSTKYFDRDQLNIIAGGGIMIFAQDVLDVTALYVRHQLTTDTSAIKFQEYSITKNVDFIAKFVRQNHRQFIGQYNIVDSTFDNLKSNATGIIRFLKENTRVPKIGGVITGGQLVSVIQDPVNIDSIIERWSLGIPVPLNNLDITIVV